MWAWKGTSKKTAQHLLGKENQIANGESQTLKDQSDWMLTRSIFEKINRLFGPLEVDLTALRLTTQLPLFHSWRPDLYAQATNDFLQDWRVRKWFVNLLWCLIGQTRVLARLLLGGAAPLGLSGAPLGSQWNAIMHHLDSKKCYAN